MVLRLQRVTSIVSHPLTRPDDLGVTHGASCQTNPRKPPVVGAGVSHVTRIISASVCVGLPSGGSSARRAGGPRPPPPGTPQSAESRAYADGSHPDGGGLGAAHHNAGRGDVDNSGRIVCVSRQVASGTRL